MAAALAAAGAVMVCRQPQYQAGMRVVVEHSSPWLQNSAAASPGPPGPAEVLTAAGELSGRATVAAAVAGMGAKAEELFAPRWRYPRWLARRWRLADQDRIPVLRRRLRIVTSASRLVEVRFTAPQPQIAAEFLRRLLAAFLQQSAARQRGMDQARIAFLQQQAATARARIQDATQSLAAVAAAEGLADPAAQMQIEEERWRHLAAAETSAELAALRQSDALAEGAAGDAAAAPPGLLVERAELDARVQSLGTEYQPQASPLLEARQQLAAVDANLTAWRGQQRRQRQQALAAVRRQTQDLRAALVRQSRDQTKLTAALARFDLAQQQVTAQRQTYATVLAQLHQALATDGAFSPSLRVADPAAAASRPIVPSWRSVLATALLLGAALSLAGIRALDGWDDRLRWPEAGELGVAVAAALPAPHRRWPAWTPAGGPTPPTAAFARGLEACAASLLTSRTLGGPRTVLVTSAGAGEGKTTLALHLADCCARTGQAVLLLDAHTAAPALHHAFGGELTPGLGELLRGSMPVEDVLRRSSTGAGPHYITAGEAAPASQCLLLASGGAGDLISAARSRFDWIFLDGPAVASGPDAGLWAQAADLTLVVGGYLRTRRRELRRCLDELEAAGAQELALVVNFAPEPACAAVPAWWHPRGDRRPAVASFRQRA